MHLPIRRSFLALAGCLVLSLVGIMPVQADTTSAPPKADGAWVTPFQAFALGGATPLFSGEYTVEREGGLLREVQMFRTAEGKVVHRVESHFDEIRLRPVFYESRDYVNGRTTVVRVVPEGFDFEMRDAQGNITKSGRQDETQGAFFWPNLVQLVDANWDQVSAGKDLDVSLFFASLNTNISVRVATDGKAIVVGTPGEQFKVVARNAFLKAFMSPIRLVFATDGSRRLLVFEGRSVVSDADRKSLDLRIEYGAPHPGCGAPTQVANCEAGPPKGEPPPGLSSTGVKRSG
jgi:hypothetical protein